MQTLLYLKKPSNYLMDNFSKTLHHNPDHLSVLAISSTVFTEVQGLTVFCHRVLNERAVAMHCYKINPYYNIYPYDFTSAFKRD